MKVEHENRSVVVFADHFTVPYNHLIKKISDEKAGVPGCLVVDLGPRVSSEGNAQQRCHAVIPRSC